LAQGFVRNIPLLISGLVLFPLAVYALIMLLAFSYIFPNGDSSLAIVFICLISLYPIVFGVSIRLSLLSYKKNGRYAYWDFIPVIYFFIITTSFYWGKI